MCPEKQWIHYCRLLPTHASVCFRNKLQALLRFRFTVQDLYFVWYTNICMQPTNQPANQPTCKQTSPWKSKLGVQPNGSPHECSTNISNIILSCGTDLVLSLYSVAVLEPPPIGYENYLNLHSLWLMHMNLSKLFIKLTSWYGSLILLTWYWSCLILW